MSANQQENHQHQQSQQNQNVSSTSSSTQVNTFHSFPSNNIFQATSSNASTFNNQTPPQTSTTLSQSQIQSQSQSYSLVSLPPNIIPVLINNNNNPALFVKNSQASTINNQSIPQPTCTSTNLSLLNQNLKQDSILDQKLESKTEINMKKKKIQNVFSNVDVNVDQKSIQLNQKSDYFDYIAEQQKNQKKQLQKKKTVIFQGQKIADINIFYKKNCLAYELIQLQKDEDKKNKMFVKYNNKKNQKHQQEKSSKYKLFIFQKIINQQKQIKDNQLRFHKTIEYFDVIKKEVNFKQDTGISLNTISIDVQQLQIILDLMVNIKVLKVLFCEFHKKINNSSLEQYKEQNKTKVQNQQKVSNLQIKSHTLEKVRLYGCKSLKQITLNQFYNLTQLDLCQSSISKIPDLKQSKKLRWIGLYGCRSLNDIDLQGFDNLVKLDLGLAGIKTLSLKNLPQLLNLNLINCRKLKIITIQDCPKIQSFKISSSLLKSLKINKSAQNSQITFIEVNFQQLQIFQIIECQKLKLLFQDCKNIQNQKLNKTLQQLSKNSSMLFKFIQNSQQ